MLTMLTKMLGVVLLLFSSAIAMHSHKFVRMDDKAMLLINGRYRPIPNNETLEFLGCEFDDLEKVVGTVVLSEPIDSLVQNPPYTPAEFMRVHTLKFRIIQDNDNLMKNIVVIDRVWNPSVIFWNGRLLMFYRPKMNSLIYMTWLNNDFAIDKTTVLFGIGPSPKLAFGDEHQQPQADARVLTLNSTHLFASFFSNLHNRVRSAKLVVDKNTQNLAVVMSDLMNPPNHHMVSNEVHKNWTPFLHNGEELFIERIHPLRVVRSNLPREGVPKSEEGREVSVVSDTTPAISPPWIESYGDIRGGTPARFIGNNRYLAFFHSRRQLQGHLHTFFMGAYVFTADEPFKLVAISRGPIVDNGRMYTGAWNEQEGCNYVYYPMSFYFNDGSVDRLPEECDHKCMHGYNITLAMGAQDREGWVVTINLLELFHTLRPLTGPGAKEGGDRGTATGRGGVGVRVGTTAAGGGGGVVAPAPVAIVAVSDEVVVCEGETYTIYDNQRHLVRDAEILWAYHYNESAHKTVTKAELEAYPVGLPLIRYNKRDPAVMAAGDPNIYLVKGDGLRYKVPDFDRFIKDEYLPPDHTAYNIMSIAELEAIPLAWRFAEEFSFDLHQIINGAGPSAPGDACVKPTLRSCDEEKIHEMVDKTQLFGSMVRPPRLRATLTLLKAALLLTPSGDVVETGVHAGGSSATMLRMMEAFDTCGRKFWAFDSFEGLPSNEAEDVQGEFSVVSSKGAMKAGQDVFEGNLKKWGVWESDRIVVTKGYFNDTLPTSPVKDIAFLRLDGDLYVSTWDGLANLYHRVVPGGFIYVDDYGSFQGCRKAVDKFREQQQIYEPLHFIQEWTDVQQITFEAVWWQKRK